MEKEEKRIYPRSRIRVGIAVSDGVAGEAEVVDLSASGLSFRSSTGYSVGAELKIILNIPLPQTSLPIEARVLRCEEETSGTFLCSVEVFPKSMHDFVFLLDYSLAHYEET